MKKYAVSTTLQSADWENSGLIKTNVAEDIRKIKAQDGMDIIVFGSVKLTHYLMQNNLVDQFNIIQYPIVVGSGQSLFGDYGAEYKLKLAKSETVSTGANILVYDAANS